MTPISDWVKGALGATGDALHGLRSERLDAQTFCTGRE